MLRHFASASKVPDDQDLPLFKIGEDTPFNCWYAAAMVVLMIGLVIDAMKPENQGFVIPALAMEYGLARATAALSPLSTLSGTVAGSVL